MVQRTHIVSGLPKGRNQVREGLGLSAKKRTSKSASATERRRSAGGGLGGRWGRPVRLRRKASLCQVLSERHWKLQAQKLSPCLVPPLLRGATC